MGGGGVSVVPLASAHSRRRVGEDREVGAGRQGGGGGGVGEG